MRNKIFKASLDTLTIVITILVLLFFVVITERIFIRDHDFGATGIIIAVSIWTVFALCYSFHPTAYELRDSILVIRCPLYSYTYPKSDIQRVRFADRTEMVATLRIFGVGGLFGYYGKFYNRTLGWMTWFATQRKNYVVLQITGNYQIVLTPDNPTEFVATLKEFLAK